MPHPPRLLLACLLFAAVSGCSDRRADKIDPSGNLTRDDYRALRERPVAAEYAREPTAPIADDGPPIPDLVNTMSAPALPAQETTLVSLSVTDAVPLRDVLIELARKAKVGLELDPRVKGGVIFSAHNQPLRSVLERLCDLAGLRYTLTANALQVAPDEPYSRDYTLDYLNMSRKSESEVALATNVFDADVGNTGGNASRSGSNNGDNNSTAKVKSFADADFWGEIEKNLTSILGQPGTVNGKSGSFSVNRQAGLVTVYASMKQQRSIEHFLRRAEKLARAQVLIEARIVEVELDDRYRAGINWRTLFDKGFNMAARLGPVAAGAPFVSAATATDGLFTASYSGSDFSAILNLVREFGATRILSSPRLTVLNNQAAVMKVARNEVYFTTSAQFPTTVTAGGVPVSGTPVFTSTPRTVPVGLVMTVQPVIHADAQEVTLNLRPTISRVVDRVSDPSIGLNAAQNNITAPVDSKIPVLAVREMDSILRLRSGEVGVMGGLMQDSSINNDKGVPPFDEVPLLGNLARARDNNGTVSELVILLRATITDQARPDSADADLYHKYNNDPRPLIPPPAAPLAEAALPPADDEPIRLDAPAQLARQPGLIYENGRFGLHKKP